ncbi:MAG: hypothetical protein BIFFINMI_03060 [Phycisphaerae bacterium]|nr:hypothetical protein [Phycisphaerae bacterium]
MSVPKWTLRRATREDTEFVYDLRRTVYREHVVATWGEWDETWQRAHFASQFDAAIAQIILVNGVPVGVVETRHEPHRIFLANICVAPGFQGRGIGSAIIRDLADDARDCGVPLELEVLKVNHDARRLYERLGFVAIPCPRDTHDAMRLR